MLKLKEYMKLNKLLKWWHIFKNVIIHAVRKLCLMKNHYILVQKIIIKIQLVLLVKMPLSLNRFVSDFLNIFIILFYIVLFCKLER